MYDSHTHTHHSHDSVCVPDELCISAIKYGLSGISITDHCDIEYYEINGVADKILASNASAVEMDKKYNGKLKVFRGIELGDVLYDEKSAKNALELCDYDVILGSVHAVKYASFQKPFSQIDFTDWSEKDICGYMSKYFDDMLKITENLDFDVLAHITVPLGYINLKYGKNYSYMTEMTKIEKILKNIISRNIALEVNTSRTALDKNGFMADATILTLYKKLGGRLITIGSDCHIAENCAFNFDGGLKLIKQCGFDTVYHFESRKPIGEKID